MIAPASAFSRTRMPPAHVDVITDHDLPRPPGNLPTDGMGMETRTEVSSEFNVLDLILAIISFAIWLVELTIWLATIPAGACSTTS